MNRRLLRLRAGALLYDGPRYLHATMHGGWSRMRNRSEAITENADGIRCEWRFTSELHIAKIFPSTGARLMRAALAQWPIEFRDDPAVLAPAPEVAFIIGHRGIERLPHLLATLRTIAAQDVAVDCIVIEQSPRVEIRESLPKWVRHIHVEAAPGAPYNRGAAFNAGAASAAARMLVFHDNDMLVPAGTAREIVARARRGAAFIEVKRFIFYLDSDATRRLFDGDRRLAETPASILQNAVGGSVAADREAFDSIGGYDEDFIGWGGEDNDFWDRAETSGRTDRFGCLPMVHLFHEAQAERLVGAVAPGVQRYRQLENVAAEERIRRLLEQRSRRH